MTVQRERSNQKKLETEKGWYSENDMKDELGWRPILVRNISHTYRVGNQFYHIFFDALDKTEGSNQGCCI
jgi:hypothetical protein